MCRHCVTFLDRLRRSTILSALGPHLCPHGFVSGSSRTIFQWVTHPGIALASNSLNFGVPSEASELPKGLVQDGGGHVHIRHITSSPLVDLGYYNPPPLGA
ncbi:unnamed protein product [Prunus armeniaca]